MDFEQIVKTYPYLAGKPIDFIYTPVSGETRMLETYPPGEPGSKESPRPKALPIGRYGIQVFSKDTRPIDVLADYVSHSAVYSDPVLKNLYQQFKSSVPESVMRERYDVHKKQYGETRPYKDWLEIAGMPEYFRGYTFNQWENPESLYSPEQLKILDKVKNYLGISQPKENVQNPFYQDPFGTMQYIAP
jgi:hypothetical protein